MRSSPTRKATRSPTSRPSDFDVFEDGKPQKISAFSLVNIPIERAERPLFAGKAIEPDVQTNEHLEGRIYLIVLDDVHTDFTRTPRVKAAARRFIEQNFGTNDLAAVVYTGRSDASQDFTNNPRLLIRRSTSSTDASCARRRSSASRARASIPRPAISSPATTSTRWIARSARGR